MTVSIY